MCTKYTYTHTHTLSLHTLTHRYSVYMYRCEQCHGLLRPDVVWYGEGMDFDLLSKVDYALRHCDLYILVSLNTEICTRQESINRPSNVHVVEVFYIII